MTETLSKKEFNDVIRQACDIFRGQVSPSEYKNYILVMLFIKCMTNLWLDTRDQPKGSYFTYFIYFFISQVELKDKEGNILDSFFATFDSLYERREATNIGELINKTVTAIENANEAQLEGVSRNIDFNSASILGPEKKRNKLLKALLELFSDPRLNLRPSGINSHDIFGEAFEYLIAFFAEGAGRREAEFYTPPEVSELLAKLMAPKSGDRIYDPACGSGSLLLKVGREVSDGTCSLYGQESNESIWSLCRMNMFLHGCDPSRIECSETIANPILSENNELMRFNIVVADPPFALDKWAYEAACNDSYNRFRRGMPSKKGGDYAFLSHMLEVALEGEGRVGVVVSHSALFRSGVEGSIRQKIIEENLLEAVIGLPHRLFFGTPIPAVIMLFNKGRNPWDKASEKRDKHILFIDASRAFEDGKKQNRLRTEDIETIVTTCRNFDEVEQYSHLATLEEIREAKFNLNISQYVNTFVTNEEVDIPTLDMEINDLEKKLAVTQNELNGCLRELGL